ncbi:MAG: helix-turn-helix domain-containing protein, partial [Candidatus Binataceae bacterium]
MARISAGLRPTTARDADAPRFKYRARPELRLTQAEKAAESRRRVLDAALSCLIDRGYSNTTTLEIASRAGLSRGSQLYHFPKKDALLTSAVEYLIELRIAEFQQTGASLPKGADLWTAAIGAFWEAWNG